METILTKIQAKVPGLSRGQKIIANYILAAGKEAALLTAAKLGKTVGVSESTVVRFALELGYDGYPAMQRELQACLLGDAAPLSAGPDSPFGREIESQISLLRRMEARGDDGNFRRAVELLRGEGRIFVWGEPWAAVVCRDLAYLPRPVSRVLGPESLLEARAGDTALLLFLEREDSAIRFCRDHQLAVVAVSLPAAAPRQAADARLTVPPGPNGFALERGWLLLTLVQAAAEGAEAEIQRRREELNAHEL